MYNDGGVVGSNEAPGRCDSLQCGPGESNHRLQSQHSYSGNHNSAQGNAVCLPQLTQSVQSGWPLVWPALMFSLWCLDWCADVLLLIVLSASCLKSHWWSVCKAELQAVIWLGLLTSSDMVSGLLHVYMSLSDKLHNSCSGAVVPCDDISSTTDTHNSEHSRWISDLTDAANSDPPTTLSVSVCAPLLHCYVFSDHSDCTSKNWWPPTNTNCLQYYRHLV